MDDSIENCTCPTQEATKRTPLLGRHPRSWMKRKINNTKNKICSRTIIFILFWHFSCGLVFNLIFTLSALLENQTDRKFIYVDYTALILLFSPLAGFLADIKFGRFQVLKFSTYLCTGSFLIMSLVLPVLAFTVHNSINYYFYILFGILLIALVIYLIGNILHISNILQFVTDQLRDVPTRESVLFLYIFYWTDNLSRLITCSINIPTHNGIIVDTFNRNVSFGQPKTALIMSVVCFSFLSSLMILLIIHKNKAWFLTEKITNNKNPYKLVYKVLRFAWLHNKPVGHPSAFTFCEDVHPSRLDFGKQKYRGPFTTEEVEDVKVILRMLLVLLTLGPAFLLETSTSISVMNHSFHSRKHSYNGSQAQFVFLDYGLLSPLLIAALVPVYVFLIQPCCKCCIPNMFKRMGLSIVLLCI